MVHGVASRGRLANHPLWARALASEELAARVIAPVIVSAAVEDRERIEGAAGLERLSLTEVVREARRIWQQGLAGLLIFGATDRKDATALLASERDHIVARAIRAVKQALPDLAVATDVCVCAYTTHGQCVLFGPGGADVTGTLERLQEIAAVHAEAGADLIIPSGMLDRTVAALRRALDAVSPDVPVAAMGKLESALYASHRYAVGAVPIDERAVPLLAADDVGAARARIGRDLADGADTVVVKPGLPALDVLAVLKFSTDRPLISFHTADEHAARVAVAEAVDATTAEREAVGASRRAGAALVITYGWRRLETV